MLREILSRSMTSYTKALNHGDTDTAPAVGAGGKVNKKTPWLSVSVVQQVFNALSISTNSRNSRRKMLDPVSDTAYL